MAKKYKIKKRKKLISPYVVFAIFAICILFVSSGYALLSDNLSIVGKANILDPDYVPLGKSTYTYRKNTDSWIEPDQVTIMYSYVLSITNLDQHYTEMELSFDVPEGFVLEKSPNNLNIWQADTITQEGNTITVVCKPNVIWLNEGDTIDLYLQLPYTHEVDMTITNVVFNGLLATYVPST